MTSALISQLPEKLFLAVLSSIIPIVFANLMVWKKKVSPSLFARFPGWRHWARSPLVIMTVFLQSLVFLMRETGTLFRPEPKPGMILLTIVMSGIFMTVLITLIYMMARSAFVPREEKDTWSAE
jgi:hypothetical protein